MFDNLSSRKIFTPHVSSVNYTNVLINRFANCHWFRRLFQKPATSVHLATMSCQEAFVSRLRKYLKDRISTYWDLLTGDFNYSSDYFFGVDSLMILAGVRLNTENLAIRRLWNVYRAFLWIPLVLLLWNLILHVTNHEALEVVISSLEPMLGALRCCSNMLLIRMGYKTLMRSRDFINRRMFGRNLEASYRIRGCAFRRIRRFVVVMAVCQSFANIPFIFMDISNNPTFRLPFNVPNQLFQYFCEKLYGFLISSYSIMYLLNFEIIVMLLTGFGTELEIIVEAFGDIYHQVADKIQSQIEADKGAGNSDQPKSVSKDTFWKLLNQEFRICIQMHQQFLNEWYSIEPLLNSIILVITMSITLTMACGAIYLLHMKSFSFYTLQILFFTSELLLECALLTRLATKLSKMHESIGERVYNLNWPSKLQFSPEFATQYRSMRATMLIVMMRSQQPLELNCFGLLRFNQEQFTELVNMAYSLVSFFRTFI